MSRMTLRKVHGQSGAGLVPANRAAQIEMDKLPVGRLLKADITNPRSTSHNGLMFAFFTLLADVLNSGPGRKDWDQNSVRKRLLIVTGHADMFVLPGAMRAAYGLPDGAHVVAFEPRSMAFDSMDQDEASRFWDRAVAYVLTEFGEWVSAHPSWREIEVMTISMRTTA